jgi:lipoprotein-anchoring transpeptidase ErfK/SrfK
MRTGGRSTLQMSWLATALAGVLGIATPAVAHLAAERADTQPAQAQVASSGAGIPVSLLHDQPYPPRTVARPDLATHRRHPTEAKPTRAVQAVRPAPAAPAIPSGPQLLVHVPGAGIVAHRSASASSPRAGIVAATSKYYHVPITLWVEDTSANGAWGKVQLPYVWPRTDGWIPLRGLKRATTGVVVSVDLSEHTVRVYQHGQLRYHVAAATGSSWSPTPTGDYVVTDRVPFGSGSPLGSFAFGISGIQPRLPSGWSGGNQLAIHGTNDPSSIGRSVSAGCVRVSEWSLAHFEPLLQLGTPVLIRP